MELRSRIKFMLPTSEISKHSECTSLDDVFDDFRDDLCENRVRFFSDSSFKIDEDTLDAIDLEDEIGFVIDMLADAFPMEGYIVKLEIPVPMKVKSNEETGEYEWFPTFCCHSPTFIYVDNISKLEECIKKTEDEVVDVYVNKAINKLK